MTSYGPFVGSIATWIVTERSCAEIPVVTPSRASIETVKAVCERRLVVLGHLPEPELVAALLRQAEADQAARVHGHEVDRLGRRELGRDRQVALVLAVGRVDDDDELALADVLDRLFDRGERSRGLGHRLGHLAAKSYRGPDELLDVLGEHVDFQIDLVACLEARRSVVSSSVCGTSATAKAPSRSAAIVSDTPSTAIEPFSTQ